MFTIEEYNKYRSVNRKMTVIKENNIAYLQLQTFNPWTGIELPIKRQEIDLLVLQQFIDSLNEQLSALQTLQATINSTPNTVG